MNNNTIIFIGMDTHKEFTEIAYSEYQREASIEHFGRIKTTNTSDTHNIDNLPQRQ